MRSGNITNFQCFENSHYYYKTKNIKYNLLKIAWRFFREVADFVEKKIAWKISNLSVIFSRALTEQYLKLDKNVNVIEDSF